MKVEGNPPHVVMPIDADLLRASVDGLGQWNESMCRLCVGTKSFIGLLPDSTDQFGVWECDCYAQLTLERYFRVRGIANNWQQLRYADMEGLSQSAKDWLINWQSAWEWNVRNGIGAVMFGSSGSGKTGLAMLILKNMMKKGLDGFVLDSNSIIDMVGFSGKEDRDAAITRVANKPLMLFDDLGREAASLSTRMTGGRDAYLTEDMLSDIVQRIIRLRVANRRPTLITTNFTEEQLGTMYGRIINDLINECSDVHNFSLDESWRSGKIRERQKFERDNHIMRPAVWG